jgi:hypothetical protein
MSGVNKIVELKCRDITDEDSVKAVIVGEELIQRGVQ